MNAAANPPGWMLVWEDQFDGFDGEKWTKVDTNETTNNSLQDYSPEQVTVEDGRLVITAEQAPSRGLPFRSGQVISKAEQLHGRWEVRAKLPGTLGTWPAIWLLPDTSQHPWPSGGEIDIMENRGNQPSLTSSAFHYGKRNPYLHRFVFSEQQTSHGGELVDFHQGFHTYAVEWTDRSLRFYVDDVNFYTVYDDEVGRFLSQHAMPMRLVINTAIGGDFLPDPDASSEWPQRFEVDWVRVYEKAPTGSPQRFRNGGFEENRGSLAGWSVFGLRTDGDPNVRVASDVAVEKRSALRLSGDSREGSTFSGVTQGVTVAEGQLVTASASSFVRTADSLAGSKNLALLKIEFYSEFGAKHGSAQMIDERVLYFVNGWTPEEEWLRHTLSARAPGGAVEARLTIVFSQPRQEPGAVYIDDVRFTANHALESRYESNPQAVVCAK